MKKYTSREMKKILRMNGYEEVRQRGSHCIFKKDTATVVVNSNLNPMVCRRLIKENNLIVSI